MHRWHILFCFAALFAVCGQAQNLDDIEGLLGDLDLGALTSAGEKCDSPKISAAGDACSKAIQSTKTPCPAACANLYKEFSDSCGELFKALGFNVLLDSCGISATPTSTPASPTTTPAAPVDEPSTDYAQPPLPNIDYTDDYAGASAEAPAVMPISTMSPSPATSSPSIPTIPGFPASCESFFAAVQSQGLEKQVACGQALADNPTECPDACKTLYATAPRPDETCMKELQAMAENLTTTDETTTPVNNPCASAIAGAGGDVVSTPSPTPSTTPTAPGAAGAAAPRSASIASVMAAGALAAFFAI